MTQPPERRIRETPHIEHPELWQSTDEARSNEQTSKKGSHSLTGPQNPGCPEIPSSITSASPMTLGGLTIVPLRIKPLIKKKHSVKMGVRQLDKSGVEVREVSNHGSVPSLHAENNTKHYILFIEGDQLIGAKQDRVCNSTVLLSPKSAARIPVSCIEEGRWRHKSRTFGSSKYNATPSLRRKISKTKEASRRESGGRQQHSASQLSVWDHVSCFSQHAGVHSETKAMQDIYEAREVELENQLKRNSENSKDMPSSDALLADCPKAVHGWILQTPDHGISIDIFGSPKLCRQAWRRMMASAAMEAMIYQQRASRTRAGKNTPPPRRPNFNLNKPKAVKKLLKAVQSVPLEQVTPVAAGLEQRIVSPELSGSYLTLENRLVHLGLTI